MPCIRAPAPDHRGPQAPLDAAPPLARELEARVAVAGNDLWTRWTGTIQAESAHNTGAGDVFRRVMLAAGWLSYLPSIHWVFLLVDLSRYSGAQQLPWLGPVAALIALVLHLRAARKPFEEVLLVLICALIGASFDSVLVSAGWVSYKSGQFSTYLAPYWIITMWMLLAMTLNVSMRWLRGKPVAAALLGFYGGPASYLAGQALGGIILTNQFAALAALAVGWAVMMPLLMRLSESLDGMPGRRRNWIVARSR